jgi:hypothetical protein
MMMPFFDSILDTFEASSAEFRHAGLLNEQADTIADGLAKIVLGIPATSAASKRVFSIARLAMPWNRCALAAQTLQTIMCLSSWFHLNYEPFDKEVAEEFESLESSIDA